MVGWFLLFPLSTVPLSHCPILHSSFFILLRLRTTEHSETTFFNVAVIVTMNTVFVYCIVFLLFDFRPNF